MSGLVLCRSSIRLSSAILGDYSTRSRADCWCRHDHRRSSFRLILGFRTQSLNILFLPNSGVPPHIPSPHFACCKIWVSCRPWSHDDSIWILHSDTKWRGERFKLGDRFSSANRHNAAPGFHTSIPRATRWSLFKRMDGIHSHDVR
jgi:hypothetical protein